MTNIKSKITDWRDYKRERGHNVAGFAEYDRRYWIKVYQEEKHDLKNLIEALSGDNHQRHLMFSIAGRRSPSSADGKDTTGNQLGTL